MRRAKGLVTALALMLVATGCNMASMPGGSFTNLSDAEVRWLEEEYGYEGGMMTEDMAHAWELRRELNSHLYEEYYAEDDYQFLCITELSDREGCLVWAGGRYVFCYKDGRAYKEMVSEDGLRFISEDEEILLEESPDDERYEGYEYRMNAISPARGLKISTRIFKGTGSKTKAPRDMVPKSGALKGIDLKINTRF